MSLSQWRTFGWIAVLILLLNIVACSRSDQQSAVDRLSDHGPGEFFLNADSTLRRILNPSVADHRFAIADARQGARLLVSPGIAPAPAAGPVAFEITWQTGTEPPKTLYRQQISAPGWSLEDVPLPSAGPGELRLRTTAASKAVLRQAGWGDPTLLSGAATGRMSVILVSLDTLRADRLGIYGRGAARTPVLDAFARDGVLYERAYSSSTWTEPSHQALLFGLQPWALTLKMSGGKPVGGWSFEGFESLAKAFRRAGYLTGAFTGGGWVAPTSGIGHGFDTYFAYSRGSEEPGKCDPARFDGPEVFKRAQGWLRQRAGAPFFLFVHTYEPHDRCPVLPAGHKPFQRWTNPSAHEVEAISRYYDELIARTDGLVGDLLRALDSLGLGDSTLVAVTSDHGEALCEHEILGHGPNMPPYEELSRVPLLLRLPGSAQRSARIDAPVSTIDLAPTLLTLAGVPVPSTMHGGVLPGLGLATETDRPIFVHSEDWLSVRKGDLKFMVSRAARKRVLYNIKDDPDEEVDLVGQRSAAKDTLRQLAKQYWSLTRAAQHPETAAGARPAVDPATAERLRALGYTD